MLYGDHPQLSGILQRIIVMTPLFLKDSSSALCPRQLESANYPKRFVNPARGFHTSYSRIKILPHISLILELVV